MHLARPPRCSLGRESSPSTRPRLVGGGPLRNSSVTASPGYARGRTAMGNLSSVATNPSVQDQPAPAPGMSAWVDGSGQRGALGAVPLAVLRRLDEAIAILNGMTVSPTIGPAIEDGLETALDHVYAAASMLRHGDEVL